MNIDRLNLKGLKSALVSCRLFDDDIEVTIDDIFSDDVIHDFNQRIVNPSNINDILGLCTYLKINDIYKFIIENAVPIEQPYILHNEYILQI